jgi:hypothetical protein
VAAGKVSVAAGGDGAKNFQGDAEGILVEVEAVAV